MIEYGSTHCYHKCVSESSGLCAYCVTSILTGDEKPEHPIPASLGASFTVHTTCDACNEWAGREIDQPFLADSLLQAHRSLVGQRDPRRGRKGRRVPSPLLQGHTADGDFFTVDHETYKPVRRSRIVDLGNDRQQIRASSPEEAQRLLERARKRAAAEGKEIKIEQEERGKVRPDLTVHFSMHTDVWRREAAKIALAVGSHVYPPSWRLSADAHRLREWMHNRDSSTDDGQAPPLVPTHVEEGSWIAEGDEHLVFFMRFRDGVYVCVCLFGASYFAVPVDATGLPVPQLAWRLDWRKPSKDGSTTWEDLVMQAVMRRTDAQAA
jgi:HNH endonuclease